MKITPTHLVGTLALVGALTLGGNLVWATVTCPPLCALPPDPSPPMPQLPLNDPPLRPLSVAQPNNSKGGTTSAASAKAVLGLPQEGTHCQSNGRTGTVIQSGGKYYCNFMPSTLPVGGACQANNHTGVIAVVDGKRYCKI